MSQAPSEIPIARAELLWREYQLSVDLYKFYLDIVVKVVIGYYAVTGTILSFYFTRPQSPLGRWALVLPCMVSFALAWLFWWGASLWEIVRSDAFRISDRLDMVGSFELSALSMLLRGAGVLLLLTGIAMVALIVFQP